MNKYAIALAAFGVGVGVMYLTDPHEGRKRRTQLLDVAKHPRSRRVGKELLKLLAR